MASIPSIPASQFANLTGVRNVERLPGAPTLPGGGEGGGASFGDLLKDLFATTNELQIEGDFKSRALLAGESRNVHETIIALEKADISFRFLNQVRNRALEAYREVLRMQL